MGATSRFRALCWECDLTGYAFGRGLAEAVIGPAVGACLAGIITLMVALVGPGTLRGWRLKKLVELIDALDEDRFPRQRAILLDKADRLASELAARYRIPTQWKVLVSSFLTIGAASGSGFVSGYIWHQQGASLAIRIAAIAIFALLTFAGNMVAYYYLWGLGSYTKYHRADFIQQGLPDSYALRPAPMRPGSSGGLSLNPLMD
jgi:hypothetical protein